MTDWRASTPEEILERLEAFVMEVKTTSKFPPLTRSLALEIQIPLPSLKDEDSIPFKTHLEIERDLYLDSIPLRAEDN